MKLASLKNETRDGVLVVVSRDLTHAVAADDIAPHCRRRSRDGVKSKPLLQARSVALNAGELPDAFVFDETKAASPLPRAYQWLERECLPKPR